MTEIAGNVEQIRSQIAAAAEKSGRPVSDIVLVAISKTHEAGKAPATYRKIRYSLLCGLIVWLMSVRVQGSRWTDPDWETMLKKSETIALVNVIQGGKFIAKVKAITIFKGEAAGEFYVTGYNNRQWPKDAIETQSFPNQRRYYLFLTRRKEEPEYLEFLAREADKAGDPESREFLARANTDALWYVWTPSAGALRVEANKVHYSLFSTSYPHTSPARDCAEFERFLKAAIAYQTDAAADSALLERTLQAVREHSTRPAPAETEENDLAHSVVTYSLLGGHAYDDVFEKIAAGQNDPARFMLARLLGGIRDERAHKLLVRMLTDGNSLVQGEVVRQLAKGDAKEVGAVLLAQLAGAGEGGLGPEGITDPVQNRVDGGKLEIIRAVGELKYQPAGPALIQLLKVVDDAYSLHVLLEALEKMGNRDYARALETPLSKGKLIFDIANWTRNHHLAELKDAFLRLMDNPPPGTRGIDLCVVSEALGAIGDEATAARLMAELEKLASRTVPNPNVFDTDQELAKDLIGALAALRYRPAHSAVERSFFYWFGIDAAFAAKPELLTTKQHLEQELERDAGKCLGEFKQVNSRALVFLENRAALVNGSETQAKHRFALQVDIRSQEHPELKAKSLRARLVKAFETRDGTIGVTRWNGNAGESSGGNDARVEGRNDPPFLWRYGQYLQAVREPADVRFAKFLMESGLAQRWGAADETVAALRSIYEQ